MKVYQGAVLTCDPDDSVHRFLVEDAGKIVWTGYELSPEMEACPNRVILEDGQVLIPAFADSHMHFASFALFNSGLDVRSAGSIPEIQIRLRQFAASRKDELITGFGASVHSVVERRLISRAELDAACPDRPVFIVKYDGHACVLNSKLINMLPARIHQLRGFHAESGVMNQEAYFASTDFVTNSIPPMEIVRNMITAADELVSRGIVKVDDVSGVGFPKDLDVDLERWFARGNKSGLQMRIFFQTMDVAKVQKRHLPRIGGCFATALDGCFGSMDAALLRPYEGTSDTGVLFYDDQTVRDFCIRANRAGLQIQVHAIGDAAFNQAVGSIEAALKDSPRDDHRHAVIHSCLPTQEGLQRCADLGIYIPLQPSFLMWDLEPLEYLTKILGDRVSLISPLRQMVDMGINISGGSDAPCTVPDAIAGMYAACNHYVTEQSLTPVQALRMYTIDGCRTTFDERTRGSLEKGKVADMVVLNGNPYQTEAADLMSLSVAEVILGGHKYEHRNSSPFSVLLRGLISRKSI